MAKKPMTSSRYDIDTSDFPPTFKSLAHCFLIFSCRQLMLVGRWAFFARMSFVVEAHSLSAFMLMTSYPMG